MEIDVLVAEIGSTTTVVNAFTGIYDDREPLFVGQGQATTTVEEGDVRIGLQKSIEQLKKNLGINDLTFRELFATSSAAGGLKMTVHGLVFDMTARAAKEAALGAGAVIHMVTAGKLRRSEIKKIIAEQPNLIMIAGGVDYGERDTSLYNAEQIANLGMSIPVIYAGNVENQEEMRLIFEDTSQELFLVENVYPKIDQLNIDPARKVIQQAFEKHIVNAPGMEHVYDVVNGSITPTPGAVMNATMLLASKLGDVLVIDVGGATTDVHSVTEGSAAVAEILVAPEPVEKRTVEGDLGLYVNILNVLDIYGKEELQKRGVDFEQIINSYNGIPVREDEIELLEILCETATKTAVNRHAGIIRYVYGPTGRSTLAQGKDLSKVKFIIGTGGALTRLNNGEEILRKLVLKENNSMSMMPSGEVKILLDHDYIMASLGILAVKYEEAALKLLERSLHYPFLDQHQSKMESD